MDLVMVYVARKKFAGFKISESYCYAPQGQAAYRNMRSVHFWTCPRGLRWCKPSMAERVKTIRSPPIRLRSSAIYIVIQAKFR